LTAEPAANFDVIARRLFQPVEEEAGPPAIIAMPDACVIEVRSRTAGIVVRDGSGYCFFAAHGDFHALERQSFDSLLAAHAAAARCASEAAAILPAAAPPPAIRLDD